MKELVWAMVYAGTFTELATRSSFSDDLVSAARKAAERADAAGDAVLGPLTFRCDAHGRNR